MPVGMHDSPHDHLANLSPGDIDPLHSETAQRDALIASHVLMVRPSAFGLNAETQETNAFVDSEFDEPKSVGASEPQA